MNDGSSGSCPAGEAGCACTSADGCLSEDLVLLLNFRIFRFSLLTIVVLGLHGARHEQVLHAQDSDSMPARRCGTTISKIFFFKTINMIYLFSARVAHVCLVAARTIRWSVSTALPVMTFTTKTFWFDCFSVCRRCVHVCADDEAGCRRLGRINSLDRVALARRSDIAPVLMRNKTNFKTHIMILLIFFVCVANALNCSASGDCSSCLLASSRNNSNNAANDNDGDCVFCVEATPENEFLESCRSSSCLRNELTFRNNCPVYSYEPPAAWKVALEPANFFILCTLTASISVGAFASKHTVDDENLRIQTSNRHRFAPPSFRREI